MENRLLGFHVYSKADIEAFAAIFFDPKATQDRLYAALAPCVDRFKGLTVNERPDFRGQLTNRVTDDQDFSKYFLDWFFDRFRAGLKDPEPG